MQTDMLGIYICVTCSSETNCLASSNFNPEKLQPAASVLLTSRRDLPTKWMPILVWTSGFSTLPFSGHSLMIKEALDTFSDGLEGLFLEAYFQANLSSLRGRQCGAQFTPKSPTESHMVNSESFGRAVSRVLGHLQRRFRLGCSWASSFRHRSNYMNACFGLQNFMTQLHPQKKHED